MLALLERRVAVEDEVEQPTLETEEADGHFWKFADLRELTRALFEYTALLDGTVIRQYRERVEASGAAPPTPAELATYERSVMRKRSTIDIAMEQMETAYPTWYRFLDLYFRRGWSCEPRGWLTPMHHLGLRRRKCPALVRCTIPAIAEREQGRLDLSKCRDMTRLCCQTDYDEFRVQLRLAVQHLWRAIENRSEWTPGA